MIYQGTSANTTGSGTQISTSVFNGSNGNMYVGFKYTSDEVHGLGTKSIILTLLDKWYNSNLISYEDKISLDSGFCNDRYPSTSSSSSNGEGGTGNTNTYYAAYIRLLRNKTPTYKCQDNADLFTDSNSSKGNKALDNPIGLITADEAAFAGGVYNTNNNSFYLYTGQDYWTMSPVYFSYGITQGFYVHSEGKLYGYGIGNTYGVRPVINLKTDVQITGTGTASDPFIVEN